MHDSRMSRRGFLRGSAVGAVSIGLGSVFLPSGCTRVDVQSMEGGGQLLERLREAGTVRVGFANEVPFGYINREGELVGEAPAVAREVFRRLGIDGFQPRVADFGSLIPGIKAGLFDVIAAGMFITPPRCAEIEFANPDYATPNALLVPEGNPLELTDFDSFLESDARVGVLTGAVEEQYVRAKGIPDGQIVVFTDQTSGVDGLLAERAEALALTRLSLQETLNARPELPLELSEPFVPVIEGHERIGGGGFGFRQGETGIVAEFNRVLDELKESNELLELVRPYGFTEDEMTDLTADELCDLPELPEE